MSKKILIGIAIIIFINYGISLVMSFFGAKTSAYSDYITWATFLIILSMFLQSKNVFTFTPT
jgi:hypothetical protein